MTGSLKAALDRVEKNVQIAKERKQKQLADVSSNRNPEGPNRKGVRGRASDAVIAEAQLSLFQLERKGRFTSFPIDPQSEFPTFLTRLPIFVPGQQIKQRALLDDDNALPFECSWGQGRRHGPLLTIYDEDTLIAIGKLRQKCLSGNPQKLPVALSRLAAPNGGDNVHVHVAQFMLSDIHRICGTSGGGTNDKRRLNSIKKLAATSIEFDNKTADKFVGQGTNVKLLDVLWQEYQQNAILYVQFTPVVAAWFESEYTYINWELRRKLSDTGKAHHRFLSSQRKHYKIGCKVLLKAIGYVRPYKKYMSELRRDMEQLRVEGWLKASQVTGNGRTIPHMLETWRD
jgi:hypothetical protein